ncbi:hypothetical protein L7F22_000320 [Adiantum nelumboides]|nr:hypothetical protein [Adiantum nelumboides]
MKVSKGGGHTKEQIGVALEGTDDNEDDGVPLEGAAACVDEADGEKEGRPLCLQAEELQFVVFKTLTKFMLVDDIECTTCPRGRPSIHTEGNFATLLKRCLPLRPAIHTHRGEFSKLNFWKRCCTSSHRRH